MMFMTATSVQYNHTSTLSPVHPAWPEHNPTLCVERPSSVTSLASFHPLFLVHDRHWRGFDILLVMLDLLLRLAGCFECLTGFFVIGTTKELINLLEGYSTGLGK